MAEPEDRRAVLSRENVPSVPEFPEFPESENFQVVTFKE